MTNLDYALAAAAKGLYVFLIRPDTPDGKHARFKGWRRPHDAQHDHNLAGCTNDPELIKRMWAVYPNDAIGVELEHSKRAVLDVDTGLKDEAAYQEWRKRNEQLLGPDTYTVKSGRTSSFGCQIWYEGNLLMGTAIKFEIDGVAGDFRRDGNLVLADGSPYKGNQNVRYAVLSDVSFQPIPEGIRMLAQKPRDTVVLAGSRVRSTGYRQPTAGEKVPKGERYYFLVSQAGKFINMGYQDPQALYDMLLIALYQHCTDPDDHDEQNIKSLAVNACRTFERNEENTAYFGTASNRPLVEPVPFSAPPSPGPAPVPTNNEKQTEKPKKSKYVYPLFHWSGTLYGEYAKLATAENFIPPEFFVEAMKVCVGSILGNSVTVPRVSGGNPRQYVILIGEAGGGKNTAIDWTVDFFSIGFKDSEKFALPKPYLWLANTRPCFEGIGASRATVASAPGLGQFLPKYNKKGVEIWPGQPRVVLVYQEMSILLEKMTLESSGDGLAGALCDLFDRGEFSLDAKANQTPLGGSLLLSVLGGIQPSKWFELGNAGKEGTGLASRWFLVPTEENRRVPTLIEPDFTALRREIFAKFTGKRTAIEATPAAQKYMGDWYQGLLKKAAEQKIDGELVQRLNVYAWKNALHHAWILEKNQVDDYDILCGTEMSDYQLEVRFEYSPLLGKTDLTRYINQIVRFLKKNPVVTLQRLKDGVHYRRMGEFFERALRFLKNINEVEIVPMATKKGHMVYFHEDEE